MLVICMVMGGFVITTVTLREAAPKLAVAVYVPGALILRPVLTWP